MEITKNEFVAVLEELGKKFDGKIESIKQDSLDFIVYTYIFGKDQIQKSKKNISTSDKKLTDKKTKNDNVGIEYVVNTHDGINSFDIIISKYYIKFQKNDEKSEKYYISEYNLEESGHFVRKVVYRDSLLNKEIYITENSLGFLGDDIYESKIESNDNMTIDFVKTKNKNKTIIYYRYTTDSDFDFIYRVSGKFHNIPKTTSKGVGELSTLLECQFDADFIKIEDVSFFEVLVKTIKEYYSNKKIN